MLGYTPPGPGPGHPPLDRILDIRLWKHYLSATSFATPPPTPLPHTHSESANDPHLVVLFRLRNVNRKNSDNLCDLHVLKVKAAMNSTRLIKQCMNTRTPPCKHLLEDGSHSCTSDISHTLPRGKGKPSTLDGANSMLRTVNQAKSKRNCSCKI